VLIVGSVAGRGLKSRVRPKGEHAQTGYHHRRRVGSRNRSLQLRFQRLDDRRVASAPHCRVRRKRLTGRAEARSGRLRRLRRDRASPRRARRSKRDRIARGERSAAVRPDAAAASSMTLGSAAMSGGDAPVAQGGLRHERRATSRSLRPGSLPRSRPASPMSASRTLPASKHGAPSTAAI